MAGEKGLLGGSIQLMLLALLSEKDFYGYQIIKELEKRSESVFQLKEGTLYPILHRMQRIREQRNRRSWMRNGLRSGSLSERYSLMPSSVQMTIWRWAYATELNRWDFLCHRTSRLRDSTTLTRPLTILRV